MNPKIRSCLAARIEAVEARIAAACRRAGRPRGAVTLVAVTKTVPAEVAGLLAELGVLDLGENRPQELWKKAAAVAQVRWHLIGHLQRNKIAPTLPLVHMIHSVDSLRLLEALEQETVKPIDVLLEVNASREASKQGFAAEEVPALAEKIRELRHVRVQGLMAMAALEDDPERCRPTFQLARELSDRLRNELGLDFPLPHLSMGMTNDFEVAIEEGATLVRVGSALFAGLDGVVS